MCAPLRLNRRSNPDLNAKLGPRMPSPSLVRETGQTSGCYREEGEASRRRSIGLSSRLENKGY
jgi:hypothetical protein